MREDDETTAGQLQENYLHAGNSLCIACTCGRGYAQSLNFCSIISFYHFVLCFPYNFVLFCVLSVFRLCFVSIASLLRSLEVFSLYRPEQQARAYINCKLPLTLVLGVYQRNTPKTMVYI